MAPHYDFHIFMCQNRRPEGHSQGCCASKGSEELLSYMKKRVQELEIKNVRVNKAGCLGQCKNGPALVIYPEGVWYKAQSSNDIEEIIQSHLLRKKPASHLKIP
jgi:(2Fe-2S) ferredoxin